MTPRPGPGVQPGTGGDDIGMSTGDHSLESDSFAVAIDASMQMQDSLDNVFDGALGQQQQQQQQQQQDGDVAPGDEALGDDGF